MFLNVNMTTWHKATLPPVPPPEVAVVCENGARSVVSSWLQEVEVGRCCLQPLGARGQGADAWCGVFTTAWFAHLAPCFFARRPKGHHVGPRLPARPGQGGTSIFLKVTSSLTALGVVSSKAVGS